MAIPLLLHSVVAGFCLHWFHRRLRVTESPLLLPVVGVYQLGVVGVFTATLFFQHEYLDGVQHLLLAAAFLLGFWAWTTAVWVYRHLIGGGAGLLLLGLLQLLTLLLLPLLVWRVLATGNFKIGG